MRGGPNKEKEPQIYLEHIYANFTQRNASALCFLYEKHQDLSLLRHKCTEKDSVRSDCKEAKCSLKVSLEEMLLESTTAVEVGPMISLLVNFWLSLQDQACILPCGKCLRSQSQSSWSPPAQSCRSCTNGCILYRKLMSYYAGPVPAETVDAPIPAACTAPSGSVNTNW